jgi:hypothetical protein
LNYLLIEALQRMDYYYGKSLLAEMPAGSGNKICLADVAMDLEKRLLSLFVGAGKGEIPPSLAGNERFGKADWQGLRLFYEYFDGDTGHGLGASHQTGWTALIAKIIQQLYVTAYSDRV